MLWGRAASMAFPFSVLNIAYLAAGAQGKSDADRLPIMRFRFDMPAARSFS